MPIFYEVQAHFQTSLMSYTKDCHSLSNSAIFQKYFEMYQTNPLNQHNEEKNGKFSKIPIFKFHKSSNNP